MIAVNAQEMRALEAETARRQGIPSFTLMDRAGNGIFRIAFRYLASMGGVRVVIVSGKGNNGGDGFIAGELLAQSGVEVSIFLAGELEEIEGDAALALKPLIGTALEPRPLKDKKDYQALIKALRRADLVIDAILGTGVTGAPRGRARDAIATINQVTECPILAIDIPSGVNADTGQIAGEVIRADLTATIGIPKVGLYFFPGAEYAGNIEVVDISIPPEVAGEITLTRVADENAVSRLLPPRPVNSHKGTFGTVGVVAGSRGMTGAAALASQSALRSGTGLVHLWTPQSLVPSLEAKLTEVIMNPVAEKVPGVLGKEGLDAIRSATGEYDVLLIGPGLRQDPTTIRLVRELVAGEPETNIVLDADGINAIAGAPEILSGRGGLTIITPHPGEFGRLMGIDSDEVQSNRLGWARRAADELDVVVVLKGARTVVAAPRGLATISTVGNSGLASAGTGDVLAGLISGLWAQGMQAFDAALLGVYLHGLTADIAAEELTEYTLVASDLLFYLPTAMSKMMEAAAQAAEQDNETSRATERPETPHWEVQ